MHFSPSSGEDIEGMVYVDDHPVKQGRIILLGTGIRHNAWDFQADNAGHFEFHAVPEQPGKSTLEFQISAEAPIKLEVPSLSRPRQKHLDIHLTSQPPPPKSSLPLEWTHGPAPLGDHFVGRTKELGELDQAWQSLSAAGAPPKRVVAWGGFGKSALLRQWLFLKARFACRRNSDYAPATKSISSSAAANGSSEKPPPTC